MSEARTLSATPLFKDFITILGNLLSCGLLDTVGRAIDWHRDWFDALKHPESERASDLRDQLATMREVEEKHGTGCLLDLDHPTVVKMIKWGRVSDEMIENAKQFKIAGQSK